MSRLRNTPVICRNTQIGFLQSIKLDDGQKRVQAFVIARGLRGKCIVPAESVKTLSGEFIIAESVKKYEREYETNGSLFVFDTDGLMIGRVSDYAIDEEKLDVEAIEVMRGYLPKEMKSRIWFYAYSAGEELSREIIVPAYGQLSQCDWKEGKETCGFQP